MPARGVHLRSEYKAGGTGPHDQDVDHGAARSVSLHHAPEESLELISLTERGSARKWSLRVSGTTW